MKDIDFMCFEKPFLQEVVNITLMESRFAELHTVWNVA